MSKRIAIIDLGTNTFNLLIVDKDEKGFNQVFSTKIGVGLGLGGINENRITEDAIERGLKVLKEYRDISIDQGVSSIHAFGTSAIRNASNKEDFLKRAEEETTIEITVLSGEEEARLIHEGVALGYQFKKPAVIMDIGGGSTEFIFTKDKKVKKAGSFEIGAARIFQKFSFADSFSDEDCKIIENYLNEGVGDYFDLEDATVLIGASGSFETFYELIYEQDYPKGEFVEIDLEKFEESLSYIIKSTKAERENNPRIIPIRKKMAPIAAIKIRWIIRKLNIQQIVISPYALKEGVIESIKIN